MTKKVIADTGVITAFLDRRDQWHEWTRQQWTKLPTPFLTCEAVVSEACFLMKRLPDGMQDVMALLEHGILEIDFDLSTEVERVASLMKRYENVPMALADACLVRMSEQHGNGVVFTLDSDFQIYRRHEKESIEIVIPN